MSVIQIPIVLSEAALLVSPSHLKHAGKEEKHLDLSKRFLGGGFCG